MQKQARTFLFQGLKGEELIYELTKAARLSLTIHSVPRSRTQNKKIYALEHPFEYTSKKAGILDVFVEHGALSLHFVYGSLLIVFLF